MNNLKVSLKSGKNNESNTAIDPTQYGYSMMIKGR
jgi:hypothetical protein